MYHRSRSSSRSTEPAYRRCLYDVSARLDPHPTAMPQQPLLPWAASNKQVKSTGNWTTLQHSFG